MNVKPQKSRNKGTRKQRRNPLLVGALQEGFGGLQRQGRSNRSIQSIGGREAAEGALGAVKASPAPKELSGVYGDGRNRPNTQNGQNLLSRNFEQNGSHRLIPKGRVGESDLSKDYRSVRAKKSTQETDNRTKNPIVAEFVVEPKESKDGAAPAQRGLSNEHGLGQRRWSQDMGPDKRNFGGFVGEENLNYMRTQRVGNQFRGRKTADGVNRQLNYEDFDQNWVKKSNGFQDDINNNSGLNTPNFDLSEAQGGQNHPPPRPGSFTGLRTSFSENPKNPPKMARTNPRFYPNAQNTHPNTPLSTTNPLKGFKLGQKPKNQHSNYYEKITLSSANQAKKFNHMNKFEQKKLRKTQNMLDPNSFNRKFQLGKQKKKVLNLVNKISRSTRKGFRHDASSISAQHKQGWGYRRGRRRTPLGGNFGPKEPPRGLNTATRRQESIPKGAKNQVNQVSELIDEKMGLTSKRAITPNPGISTISDQREASGPLVESFRYEKNRKMDNWSSRVVRNLKKFDKLRKNKSLFMGGGTAARGGPFRVKRQDIGWGPGPDAENSVNRSQQLSHRPIQKNGFESNYGPQEDSKVALHGLNDAGDGLDLLSGEFKRKQGNGRFGGSQPLNHSARATQSMRGLVEGRGATPDVENRQNGGYGVQTARVEPSQNFGQITPKINQNNPVVDAFEFQRGFSHSHDARQPPKPPENGHFGRTQNLKNQPFLSPNGYPLVSAQSSSSKRDVGERSQPLRPPPETLQSNLSLENFLSQEVQKSAQVPINRASSERTIPNGVGNGYNHKKGRKSHNIEFRRNGQNQPNNGPRSGREAVRDQRMANGVGQTPSDRGLRHRRQGSEFGIVDLNQQFSRRQERNSDHSDGRSSSVTEIVEIIYEYPPELKNKVNLVEGQNMVPRHHQTPIPARNQPQRSSPHPYSHAFYQETPGVAKNGKVGKNDFFEKNEDFEDMDQIDFTKPNPMISIKANLRAEDFAPKVHLPKNNFYQKNRKRAPKAQNMSKDHVSGHRRPPKQAQGSRKHQNRPKIDKTIISEFDPNQPPNSAKHRTKPIDLRQRVMSQPKIEGILRNKHRGQSVEKPKKKKKGRSGGVKFDQVAKVSDNTTTKLKGGDEKRQLKK